MMDTKMDTLHETLEVDKMDNSLIFHIRRS